MWNGTKFSDMFFLENNDFTLSISYLDETYKIWMDIYRNKYK